ncbi:energy-converting hydrogenase A subunit A EhaA [Methanobrevibacter millerae]|uniref:Probable [NiFe]-hydrogenase-type-3 Eha complex membrane subunit A n=1 Tax=Methanobrevibacter millerae TaxID=230361 RepID=A0A1G5VR87_9EURY|nr:energy-converting hydrogenase A subunit A EhaA [Methanobrevibacter millerae]SDA48352.1 energy-converting hydrogenase A subunit A [Methanobrevibacter millerae]
MFELVHTTVGSLAIANVYGLSNISISYFDMILAYLVAIVVSIIVALILRVPLLPSMPYRYSFDVSAVYPTPIIAIGVLSLFLVLNYTFKYNGLLLAAIIGICSALFVKYLFDYIFPSPAQEEDK